MLRQAESPISSSSSHEAKAGRQRPAFYIDKLYKSVIVLPEENANCSEGNMSTLRDALELKNQAQNMLQKVQARWAADVAVRQAIREFYWEGIDDQHLCQLVRLAHRTRHEGEVRRILQVALVRRERRFMFTDTVRVPEHEVYVLCAMVDYGLRAADETFYHEASGWALKHCNVFEVTEFPTDQARHDYAEQLQRAARMWSAIAERMPLHSLLRQKAKQQSEARILEGFHLTRHLREAA